MLAIIPARGGSKGLPGKNIRPFNGKPLIAYAIEVALKSKAVTRVVVSTDAPEIASVAIEYGAEVIMRPEELATDTSAALDAFLYTVEEIERREKKVHPAFIVLYPTAPLRTQEQIDGCIQLFYDREASSVISVTESDHPVEWARVIEGGILKEKFQGGNLNRQSYDVSYFPNGLLYVFNYQDLKETREYYMDKTYPYIIDKLYCADIDDLLDFQMAEFKYRLVRNIEGSK